MKYLVMECNLSYAVVLDEQGRFIKVANLNYTAGQTVTNIIEMQPKPTKKVIPIRTLSTIAAVAACMMLMLTSMFYLTRMPYASVYMQINPEVRIDVNKNDNVVGLEGLNEDGKHLITGYSYKNKMLDTVVDELVDCAIDLGYLSEGKTIALTFNSEHEEWEISTSTKLEEHLKEYLSEKVSVTIEVAVAHPKDEMDVNKSDSDYDTQENVKPIVIPVGPSPTEEPSNDDDIVTPTPTPSPTQSPTPSLTPTPSPSKAPVGSDDSQYEDSDYNDVTQDDESDYNDSPQDDESDYNNSSQDDESDYNDSSQDDESDYEDNDDSEYEEDDSNYEDSDYDTEN